ncbi:MAG TPA: TonB family protein, partial [Terriglobales bacterium]|nr:TonB family protein [Terriglobales bacterium]
IRFTRIKPDSSAVLKRWLKSEDPAEESSTSSEASAGAGLQPARAHNEVSQLRDAISAGKLEGRAALNFIVERMLLLTRASGAAIALRQGDEVLCRATVGNAPDVGTRLNLDASVTGECYRTGTIVSITDSENDPRVDAELCRQLEFRALLIVPITVSEEVLGIAEVFSPIPGNFEGGDILLLGSIAEVIAEIHESQDQRWMIPAVRLAYHIPVLERASRVQIEESMDNIEDPVRETSVGRETVAECKSEPNRQETGVQHVDAREIPENPTSVSDTRNTAPSDTNWKPRTYALMVALFGLLTIALGDFLDWHLPPYRHAAHAATDAMPVLTNQPADVAQPTSENVESGALANAAATAEDAPALQPPAINPALLKKAAAKNGTVHPNLQRISAEDVQVEQQIPSASVFSATESLGTAGEPPLAAPESSKLEHISPTQLTPAKLIHRVEPIFPDFAKDAGLGGTILLSATIGTDGRLKDVKLVNGNRALATEAFRALREWRYRPYLLKGKPIEAETRIVMNFHR